MFREFLSTNGPRNRSRIAHETPQTYMHCRLARGSPRFHLHRHYCRSARITTALHGTNTAIPELWRLLFPGRCQIPQSSYLHNERRGRAIHDRREPGHYSFRAYNSGRFRRGNRKTSVFDGVIAPTTWTYNNGPVSAMCRPRQVLS